MNPRWPSPARLNRLAYEVRLTPKSPFDAETSFAAWRGVADALPTMVFTATPDGRIEYLNRRFTEFTGFPPRAALGTGWHNLVHPQDLARVIAAWQQAIATGRGDAIEARIRKADGSFAWFASNATAFRDARGEVVRWYGILVNIDGRKRMEAMLADAEQKSRVLGEALPVICWTADASGWTDWYNRRWYEFTGQSPDQATGWGWQAAHHPDDFIDVMERWPHSIATGEPFEMEFRLRRYDGKFRWFLTRAEPLRDESGKVVRWYGSHVDIDAQKSALERTRRIAETLQDVFLPKNLPQLPNLRLDAVYIPAERDALVGGDWYDAFPLPDGRLVVSIGDVTGHGLEASIIVGRLRQTITILALQSDDPSKILVETDRILQQQDPNVIVTAIVAVVDPEEKTLTYACAGHPPPLVAYRNDEPARVLSTGGPPLGVGHPNGYTAHRVELEKDAIVAFYTDGITEFARDVMSAERALCGALALLVGNTSILRPAVTIQDIVLNGRPTHDDAALLLMQFSKVEKLSLRSDPVALEKHWRFHSSDAYAAHHTRQELMAYMRGLAADADQVFSGELILGELLANTVEHAPGLVEVRIDWTGPKPVVFVRDTGPGLDKFESTLPEPLAEDGRGLFLIKALAEELSVKRAPGYGTEFRAVLPIARKALR